MYKMIEDEYRMYNGKNIFVIGGVGFIGFYMMFVLKEVGFNVIVYDNFFIGYCDVCFGYEVVIGEFVD